jgi:homoserine O-acetyltransferase
VSKPSLSSPSFDQEPESRHEGARGRAPDASAATSGLPEGYAVDEGVLTLASPFPLYFGGTVPRVEIAYRLAGASDAPVVAALGGISAGRHVFDTRPGRAGWWDEIVGPGKPLDTDRYRVLGIDFLGGSHRSTGPARGEVFPSVSAYDQARCLLEVMRHLGVAKLRGCVGASYGGMVTLALADQQPQVLEHAVIISAAHRTHPMSTAWRSVQRNFVRYAITHGEGAKGLVLARALAMATYRSAREFEDRFPGEPHREAGRFVFPVEAYLVARGESYAGEYRPEAFVCLSESIDLHRIEPERIHVPLTMVGVVEDQLVPIADMRTLRDRAGGSCQLVEISSLYGHDAFFKETAVLRDVFAQALG